MIRIGDSVQASIGNSTTVVGTVITITRGMDAIIHVGGHRYSCALRNCKKVAV